MSEEDIVFRDFCGKTSWELYYDIVRGLHNETIENLQTNLINGLGAEPLDYEAYKAMYQTQFDRDWDRFKETVHEIARK
jgi:hypothetical protein